MSYWIEQIGLCFLALAIIAGAPVVLFTVLKIMGME
jgi:hypothetical protein